MGIIRDSIKAPYWAGRVNVDFPGCDFNREIVDPGTNATFPDGAVGIRTDDDYWPAAALPLSFIATPLPEIVADLWPETMAEATFLPDSPRRERGAP